MLWILVNTTSCNYWTDILPLLSSSLSVKKESEQLLVFTPQQTREPTTWQCSEYKKYKTYDLFTCCFIERLWNIWGKKLHILVVLYMDCTHAVYTRHTCSSQYTPTLSTEPSMWREADTLWIICISMSVNNGVPCGKLCHDILWNCVNRPT